MTLRRLSALTLVVIVILSIGTQFVLNGAKPGLEPWGARVWDLMRYFTILTCTLVGVVMWREAIGRNRPGRNLHATVAMNIVMVGVIFQILLAPEVPLTGIDWWPDFGFHAAIPVLAFLWWAVWGPKRLSLSALPLWLIWPFGYAVYALARGGIEGKYPYFFLDVAKFGIAQVAINVVGLVVAFAGAGVVLWLLSRLLPRSAI